MILAYLQRVAGGLRRRGRSLLDRLGHPGRRRLAIESVSGRPPQAVVAVCLGNICRSPYAEQALRRACRVHGLQVHVSSAGLIGPGRPAHPLAVDLARERGLDLTTHESRLVGTAEPGSLLLLMDPAHSAEVTRRAGQTSQLVLGDLDPYATGGRAIPDPYGRPREEFIACFDRIDRCVDALVAAWRA